MAAEAKAFGRVHAKANGSGNERAGGRMECRPLAQAVQALEARPSRVAIASRRDVHANPMDTSAGSFRPSAMQSLDAAPACMPVQHPASSASPAYASRRPLTRYPFRSGNKVEHFAHKADVSGYESSFPIAFASALTRHTAITDHSVRGAQAVWRHLPRYRCLHHQRCLV